ncbi:hypothetical protein JKP88DRAFT_288087 [Tribonema minus]|uniref:PROP1-like PPR domain-containing protein n=1 Tax=Tribonema minus TaxID=303371 RepID=A0A835Z8F7_9STRA|nr:hypothetical protein JKP88DRAFT_288087 [Tribonema minus]
MKLTPSRDMVDATLAACEKGGSWLDAYAVWRSSIKTSSAARRLSPRSQAYLAHVLRSAGKEDEAHAILHPGARAEAGAGGSNDRTQRSGGNGDSARAPRAGAAPKAIAALCRAGKVDEALRLLDSATFGAEPDASSSANGSGGGESGSAQAPFQPAAADFDAVIAALGRQRRRTAARGAGEAVVGALLRRMRARGFTPSAESYTWAMVECNAARRYAEAVDLLDEALAEGVEAGVVAFNAAINAAAKLRDGALALVVLEEMRARSVAPTAVTFGTAMSAFARATQRGGSGGGGGGGSGDDAVEFADTALQLLRQPTDNLQCGVPMKETGVEPQREAYDGVMSALVNAGRGEEALEVMAEMEAAGTRPGVHTMSIAMGAYGQAGDWRAAVALLGAMRARGVAPDAVVYNAAIAACGDGGGVEGADAVAADMAARGVPMTVVTHTSLITAYGRAGDWERAVDYLRRLRAAAPGDGGARGGSYNVRTYNAALAAVAHAAPPHAPQLVAELLRDMRAARLAPDAYSFNAAVLASGDWHAGREYMQEMAAAGVPCTEGTYINMMRVCAGSGSSAKAVPLLRAALASGLPPSTRLYNACLAALAKAGDVEAALQLLEDMRGAGSSAGSSSISSGGDAAGEAGGASSAAAAATTGAAASPAARYSRRVLVQRSAAGAAPGRQGARGGGGGGGACVPDAVSWNIVIDAAAKAGDWALALWLLSDMKRHGIAPDSVSWGSAIDACSRGGNSEARWAVRCGATNAALALLERMRVHGVPPDAHAYASAMSACQKAKRGDAMRAEGLSPTAHHLAPGIHACARAGDHRGALALLAELPRPDAHAFGGAILACARARAAPAPRCGCCATWPRAASRRRASATTRRWARRRAAATRRAPPRCWRRWRRRASRRLCRRLLRGMGFGHASAALSSPCADELTFASAVHGLCAARNFDGALAMEARMRAAGLQVPSSCYSALVAAAARAAQVDRGIALLRAATAEGCALDTQAFAVLLLAACGDGAAAHTLFDILALARAPQHGADAATLRGMQRAAADALAAAGRIVDAGALLDAMPDDEDDAPRAAAAAAADG